MKNVVTKMTFKAICLVKNEKFALMWLVEKVLKSTKIKAKKTSSVYFKRTMKKFKIDISKESCLCLVKFTPFDERFAETYVVELNGVKVAGWTNHRNAPDKCFSISSSFNLVSLAPLMELDL